MQDEIGDFVTVLDEFLKINLEGDSCLCLDFLNEKLKFLVMKMKNSPTGLSIETTTDPHFKRKFKFVPHSAELIAKIKFTLENDLYIYHGSLDYLTEVTKRIDTVLNRLREMISRSPRMALMGPKTLNRAFYPFEGSMRFMVGFVESQGSRPTMEDEIVIFGMGPRMRRAEDYFAVFDGHGGPEASAFAAKHLHEMLDSNLCDYPQYASGACNLTDEQIVAAFRNTFKELDNSMCVQYGMQAGACALVSYFTDSRMFTANLGDSRCVMGTKQGTVRITNDHKPMNPDEYARITSLEGGFVSTDSPPARVQGQLSVSRALGDRPLKPYVSGEPDIFCRQVSEDDYFIVLGCDGVWDKITDDIAVEITMRSSNPQEAAANIFKKLKGTGKSDNL